jgi:hypothetical protein
MTTPEENATTFIDLAAYGVISKGLRAFRGNIIKRQDVRVAGTRTIQVAETPPGDPAVHIHRNGDHVESIEFVCECGRTALISLEYSEI